MTDLPTSVSSAHSAAVYRYAVELVEDTRRSNDTRMADARDLAAVVRIADEPAADRILSAAEEACARDLHIAEQQADEVVRHARAGIMAAVQRYAQALVEEARTLGQSRLDKATELAELVRLADANSADRLLQAIHTVNEAGMRTAERQAHSVLETAQTRLTIAPRGQGPTDSNPGQASAPQAPATEPAPASAGYGSTQSEVNNPSVQEAQTAQFQYSDPATAPAAAPHHPPVNGMPATESGVDEADPNRSRQGES